jgi:hypothetical protein
VCNSKSNSFVSSASCMYMGMFNLRKVKGQCYDNVCGDFHTFSAEKWRFS